MIKSVVRGLAAIEIRSFYVGLAMLLGLLAIVNFARDSGGGFHSRTYDWMVKHRFHTPTADRDIVILDIDEKSLAQMGSEFGRWPWPRDVLGAVLAELELQGARAVVFDILFSDPDKQNPVSEQAFSDAIAASRASFFTVLRLNPDNDGKSLIAAKDLPGLISAQPNAEPTAQRTLALVPPYFASAVASGRLGVHNLYPDRDGVIRHYRLWEDVAGWRIASMPQRLGNAFAWPQQQSSEQLIQWMAKPLAFTTVSFSDLYRDSQRKKKTRPADEFKGKIVLIGSTATSLFDVKGTPLAAIHPGVDVLATAIDNLKNQRFQVALPDWVQLAITLCLLVLMVWMTIHSSHQQIGFAFMIGPLILMLVSYLTLNLTGIFIDLSASASAVLLFFSLATFYLSLVRQYRSGQAPFAESIEAGREYCLGCLAVLLPRGLEIVAYEARLLNLIRKHAPHAMVASSPGSAIKWLETGSQKLVVATWAIPAANQSACAAISDESQQLTAQMKREFGESEALVARFTDGHAADNLSADEFAKLMRDMVAENLQGI